MSIELISDIVPKNNGLFPTHSDIYGKGGYQVQPTTTARDAIPTLNRKQGMVCYVVADSTEYRLDAGLTTWTPVASGGGTLAGDVTGPASANTVVNLTGAAGKVTVPTAALSFGASPAAALGLIRVPHNVGIIYGRSQSGLADISLMLWGTPGNSLKLGDTGNDSTVVAGGTSITTLVGASGRVDFLTVGVRVANNNIYFSSGVTTPKLSQDVQTSNVSPPTLTIQPSQPFNNVITTGANQIPGNLLLDMGTPANLIAGSVYNQLNIRFAGLDAIRAGFNDVTLGTPYMRFVGTAVGATSPALSGWLRFPHNAIILSGRNSADTNDARLIESGANSVQFGSSVYGSTVLAAQPGGFIFYSIGSTTQWATISGENRSYAPLLTWDSTTANPTLQQNTKTTNTLPQTLTIQPQQPWNDPTTTGLNAVPASIRFDMGNTVNGASVYNNVFWRWVGIDRITFSWTASGGPAIALNGGVSFPPASAGLIRLPHIDIPFLVTIRNAANNNDLRAISINVADSMIFGDSAAGSSTNIQSGQGVFIQAGGVTRAFFQGSVNDHADFGAAPASLGAIRLTQGFSIYSRNTAGLGDIRMMFLDNGDNVEIGGTSGGSTAELAVRTLIMGSAEVRIIPGTSNGTGAFGWTYTQPGTLQWGSSLTAPLINQAINPADIVDCADFTIQTQRPFATSTGTHQKPGNLILDLGTNANSYVGGYPSIQIKNQGIVAMAFTFSGSLQYRLTGGAGTASDPYLQLIPGGGFVLKSQIASNSVVDPGPSGNFYVQRGGVVSILVGSGIYFGQSITWLELPSGGALLQHATRTTNAPPQDLIIRPQQPFNDPATTGINNLSGSLVVDLGANTNGYTTTYSQLQIKHSGATRLYFSTDGATFAGWVGPTANAAVYWLLTGSGGLTFDTGGAAGLYKLRTAGTDRVTISSTVMTLSALNQLTTPTLITTSAGVDMTIQHANRSTDVPANNLVIKGTAASTSPASSGTNADGGRIQIIGGRKDNGTGGRLRGLSVYLSDFSNPQLELSEVQASTSTSGLGTRVLSMFADALMTTAKMPTGTGDLVMFVGNAASVPTVNATSGHIYYSDGGNPAWRFNGLNVRLDNISATATAGAGGAPPATIMGYLQASINGTTVKIPYYAA